MRTCSVLVIPGLKLSSLPLSTNVFYITLGWRVLSLNFIFRGVPDFEDKEANVTLNDTCTERSVVQVSEGSPAHLSLWAQMRWDSSLPMVAQNDMFLILDTPSFFGSTTTLPAVVCILKRNDHEFLVVFS